jgi:hypothetical protein
MTPSDKVPGCGGGGGDDTECSVSQKTLLHMPSEFSEHTLLLQNNSTPQSPKSATPPHKLCLETSFTSLNPSQRSSASSNSATPIAATPFLLHPTLPWEYVSMLEEQLQTITRSTPPSSIANNKKARFIFFATINVEKNS